MNNIHLVHYERAQRVASLIDSQPGDFPEGSKVASLGSSVKQEFTKLAELDIVRSSSMSRRKQATAARRHAHKLLVGLVRKVIGTADVIALDHPEVEGLFVRPQKNSNDQTLISDARSLAEKAAPFVGLFTENGLAPTFINDLRSFADSIEHAIQLQTDSVGERVRANADIKETIHRLNDLHERLDIPVRNKYENDHAKLAAWESARHLKQSARSKRNGEDDAPPSEQQ
jgi:hypothetical protein